MTNIHILLLLSSLFGTRHALVPSTGLSMCTQVMVRDACCMNTACYFALKPPELGSQEEAATRGLRVSTASDGIPELDDDPNDAQKSTARKVSWVSAGDLNYHSVWSTDHIKWNIWLKQWKIQWFLMSIAWILMAITVIEEPFNKRINFWDFNLHDVPHWVAHAIFFACHGVLLALFILVFSCMWPTRHWWLAKNLAKHSSAQGNR